MSGRRRPDFLRQGRRGDQSIGALVKPYDRTPKAAAILANGFRDTTDSYGTDAEFTGVSVPAFEQSGVTWAACG